MHVPSPVAALLLGVLLAGCGRNQCPEPVRLAQYGDLDKCWGGTQSFAALVALTPTATATFQPTFISTECQFRQKGFPGWASVFEFPRIPPVVGDEGLARQMGLLDRPISDNLTDHLAGPRRDSKLYKFRAQLQPVTTSSGVRAYQLAEILELDATGKSVENLITDPCYQ